MKSFFSNFEKFAFRYFNFWDRATRAEYWCVMPVLWGLMIFLLAGDLYEIWTFLLARQVPPLTPFYYDSIVVFLLTAIPRLSLTVRRLHDSGKSGKWAGLPIVALQSTIVLTLGVGSALMTSGGAGGFSGAQAGAFALVLTLAFGQFDAFWQGLFGIAATINAMGSDAVLGMFSGMFGAQTPEPGVVVSNLGRNIQANPAEGGKTMLAMFAITATPFIATFLYLFFMLRPSDPDHNAYGQSSVAPIAGFAKGPASNNPMAGYAHLVERSAEEEAALKMRQKEEVKSLYQQRVLGRAETS